MTADASAQADVPPEIRRAIATVEAAIDSGVGWIDTAPFYGWGLAERIVGRSLRSAGRRVAVLTKCGTQRGDTGGRVSALYGEFSF